ncbi:pitrilysin family protein [Paenirhodobacter sp. CAU 1674]|uniref:M16 family metallopeptidase n=1 Tax=Paenirhodobacter sp. CAU 1674 TaxID=3032596 RepID=UPI0023D9D3C2|nr:pitrilysin family protein [Paenirhodobacter sp. CAU 1674]MDF2140441.1 pitrilysin family protein [Paenirhodobacter sp. CAU 1674]
MVRASLAAAFLWFAAAPLWASPVSHFTLENGLEAVVIEDHRAPVVVHMVWYKVGSADELRSKSGIAHYFEHLMFKGTDTMAAGELSKTVAANGGSDNAFTSYDYTAYYQRIAADRLELVMKMEADRMRHLKISPDDWKTERDVILEERAQRTDSDPGALFGEQKNAAQFLNHPYGTPIIGWRQEMEALTRDDALAWYPKYYAPNNAVLVVAGDVTPDQVRTLAETYYGVLAPTPDLPERQRPQEPPQLAERRLVFPDARVAQPYLSRSYLAPERDPGDQKQAAALTVLAEVLGGNSATSVLGRKLIFGDGSAIYASAYYDGMAIDDTTFNLAVMPVADVTLPEAEAALDRALADFLKEGIDPAQFERIRTRIRASEIYAQDNTEGLARRYGEALASGFSIEDVQSWPDVLMSVTEEDVMAAARAVFDKRHAVTGYLTRPELEAAQ